MTSSIIEITENEYLIKLNRHTFDLSLIRTILRMVEVSNPADDYYEMPDRHISSAQNRSSESEPGYYSSLDEK